MHLVASVSTQCRHSDALCTSAACSNDLLTVKIYSVSEPMAWLAGDCIGALVAIAGVAVAFFFPR